MDYHRIERTIVVTIGSRLALLAIAVANWDKASWAFQQWSRSGALQADIMAGAIEGSLVIFTYMLAQRLMGNARKLKSDPEQPTRTLWGFVVFLSILSAFCNGLYFTHFGMLANPLGNVLFSILAGIILGLAAPALAGGIAYLQGEETSTEISVEEAKLRREEKNARARENRKLKKLAEVSEAQKKTPEISGKPVEVSERAIEGPVMVSPIIMKHLEKTAEAYTENPKLSLGDLAEILAVGLSRASEIRAMAVEFRLLDKVSAREFSVNGGEVSVEISEVKEG